jgi:hypothetical protein
MVKRRAIGYGGLAKNDNGHPMVGTQYIGKAGQFAVMAELAFRGYNVAIPEIDVGDDVFVVNQGTGFLSRIQVKTATGRKLTQKDLQGNRFIQVSFRPILVM